MARQFIEHLINPPSRKIVIPIQHSQTQKSIVKRKEITIKNQSVVLALTSMDGGNAIGLSGTILALAPRH